MELGLKINIERLEGKKEDIKKVFDRGELYWNEELNFIDRLKLLVVEAEYLVENKKYNEAIAKYLDLKRITNDYRNKFNIKGANDIIQEITPNYKDDTLYYYINKDAKLLNGIVNKLLISHAAKVDSIEWMDYTQLREINSAYGELIGALVEYSKLFNTVGMEEYPELKKPIGTLWASYYLWDLMEESNAMIKLIKEQTGIKIEINELQLSDKERISLGQSSRLLDSISAMILSTIKKEDFESFKGCIYNLDLYTKLKKYKYKTVLNKFGYYRISEKRKNEDPELEDFNRYSKIVSSTDPNILKATYDSLITLIDKSYNRFIKKSFKNIPGPASLSKTIFYPNNKYILEGEVSKAYFKITRGDVFITFKESDYYLKFKNVIFFENQFLLTTEPELLKVKN